ncbi:hypothetical protein DFH07DRAFT_942787 [Mycena maculata]|uniref:Uncharacterized protein n=1 Tax=Mycena maculata TaxID=230809 RepID=A0AAD7ILG8_9AGAR|nr:hypothetical protein DFH07DRAFT_942787 [Mycena maculata]
MSSSSGRSAASRSLALHPSALSDAEHALFSASFSELVDDSDWDWAQASVSVREARAWMRGRYAAVGTQTVDEILRLFASAPSLAAGEFFAALRLVLHAQAGRSVDRSLAFVQAPVPTAIHTSTTNPFLPTPAPSPEAPARPPLPPRKPTATVHARANIGAANKTGARATSSVSSASTSSSDSVRRHVYSASLSAAPMPLSEPPTHPLRRAATQTQPRAASSSTSLISPAAAPLNPNSMQRTVSGGGTPRTHNPFRAPPPPPRRATSVSVPTSPVHSPPGSRIRSPTADAQYAQYAPQHATSNSPFSNAPPRTAPATSSTFRSAVQPPTPREEVEFAMSMYAGAGAAPPVHPQRRAGSFDSSPQPISQRPDWHRDAPDAPRDRERDTARDRERERQRDRAPDAERERRPLALPMPKALRRTLAGAGWVGAERGERVGLVSSVPYSSASADAYTPGGRYEDGHARRYEDGYAREGGYAWEGERRGSDDGEGEAWGAL